ncbi:MarR family winged helix-turn-helix transcriptional regulator [Gynuella sp.]|uniref:MarR family winged helix-turn-helix transcriptional regulator n=1 Tax=Gynuella sp. TaxID=2969146 RepID=UPI003D0F22B2
MSSNDRLNNPGFLIADIHRLVRRLYVERADQSSLTLAQAKALLFISKHEGVKQKELADVLDIQPMTLVKVLDHLASERLIVRQPDPNDRRAHLIHLCEDAGPHLAQVEQTTQQLLTDMLQDLEKQEVEQLINMLIRIRNRLLSL